MSSESLAYLIPKLGELIFKEFGDHWNTERVKNLKKELNLLRARVIEADRRRDDSAVSLQSVWISDVRLILFEIEDLIESHTLECDLEELKETSCISFLEPLAMRPLRLHKLHKDFERIEKQMENINANWGHYCTGNSDETVSSPLDLFATANISKWDYLGEIKIDEKINVLTDKLVTSRGLLFIHGEAGTGKSHLTQKVYGSQEISFTFHPRIYFEIQPGDEIDKFPTRLLEGLLEKKDDLESISPRQIRSKIIRFLNGKRYLIVVDNVTTLLELEYIQNLLPNKGNSNGCLAVISRRIFPNQNKRSSFNVENFNKENSNEFLYKNIYPSFNRPSEFSQFEEELYNISKGNPLAILLLSGMLKYSLNVPTWKKIVEQIPSYIRASPLYTVLVFAFDYLPAHLKPCLLYLSFVPNPKIISAQKLFRLWISEGFVQDQNEKTLEQNAEFYLEEIVSRRFIRVVSKNVNGSIKEVTVHEGVFEFIKSESQRTFYVEHYANAALSDQSVARRVVLFCNSDQQIKITQSGSECLKMRSLNILEKYPQSKPNPVHPIEFNFLALIKLLRVLEINTPKLKSLPDEIGRLVLLKYISLTSTNLTELPSSIDNLINIQTLDVAGTSVKGINEKFWYNKSLRNILGSFPVPKCFGSLESIHRIDKLDFDNWNQNTDLFYGMLNLRVLCLNGVKSEQTDSLIKLLGTLVNVRELGLGGETLSLGIFGVYELKSLVTLELNGNLMDDQIDAETVFNAAFNFQELKSVSLSNSCIGRKLISLLAKLPSLLHLKLTGCWVKTEGENTNFPVYGFGQLQTLEIFSKFGRWEMEELIMAAVVFENISMIRVNKDSI